MSANQNSTNSNPEEIDLGQLFSVLNRWLKKMILGIFAVTRFYKQKALLFGALALVGAIAGYFWDARPLSKGYTKELILEPNYEITNYIYDYIEDFNENFKKEGFLLDIGAKQHYFDNLVEISITPLEDYTNILDYFEDKYTGSNFLGFLNEAGIDLEVAMKYYQRHKITFNFKGAKSTNENDIDEFMKFLNANEYFAKRRNFVLKELSAQIEDTEKTIKNINSYITKISEHKSFDGAKGKHTIVYTNEEEIPTVTSLLRQRELLMERLSINKERVYLKNDLITVVSEGELTEKKTISNMKVILLPLLLTGIVTFLFFITFLVRWMKNYSLTDH